MILSAFKQKLQGLDSLDFKLENGQEVPKHFHVTEVGVIDKKFIDCGGTIRSEQKVNFQLWQAEDYDHRLAPQKLLNIIELSEKHLEMGDYEIEVEFQMDTIGKFNLEFDGSNFILTSTVTDCLAKDKCGVETTENKVADNACTPGGGCC